MSDGTKQLGSVTELLEAIAKPVVTETKNKLTHLVLRALGEVAMQDARRTGEDVVFSTRGNNVVRLEGRLHFDGPHRVYTISPNGEFHYQDFDGEGLLPQRHKSAQDEAARAYVDSLGFPQF